MADVIKPSKLCFQVKMRLVIIYVDVFLQVETRLTFGYVDVFNES